MPSRLPTHRMRVPRPIGPSKPGRDVESNRFYASARWRKLRLMKLRRDPLCQDCLGRGELVPATIAHHAVELRDDWDRGLDEDNLRSMCPGCHSRLHALDR